MATYPSGLFTWTDRVDNVDTYFAADPNSLAAEIIALETVLGANFVSPPKGRLTLLTNTPIAASDQTAKTSVFYTPYIGRMLPLWDGSKWINKVFNELSVAVPATTNTPYDMFSYLNSGAPTLETLNWTNDTTRATALVLDTTSGMYIKSGDATRLYLGTGRTTGSSGQIEDSVTKRFLFNMYNRAPRRLFKQDITGWTTNTATWRQMRATATNMVELVNGDVGMVVPFRMVTDCAAGAGGWFAGGAGLNITNGSNLQYNLNFSTARAGAFAIGTLDFSVGYSYVSMNEITSGATATITAAYLHGEVMM